ncbi:MAG: molybdopterin molybdotransferase MoeA [Negativicutes bacterium]|nr:molybdopterin molybdotransferase MoeA [Negativicutes bacterium]
MAIKLEIAQKMLLEAAAVRKKEQVPLAQCHGRVLAVPVLADSDFPPFDRSPLDGYALIAAEVADASATRPAVLRVVDDIPAGTTPRVTVTAGTAARIMTGAPIPSGATGVIRLEDTLTDGTEVSVLAGAGAEANICRQGEEIAAGEELAGAGTPVNAGVMGILALNGISRPWVYRRPRVALIATGSEVVSLEAPLLPGTIRNSNSYMLSAQVCDAGAEPVLIGIGRDDVAELAALFEQAAECDLIISTGGVSTGDYDLLAEVYRHLGISALFDRVAMKPGMPVLAGLKGDKLYIGLSGNPAAASVSFEALARPVLLKMAGRKAWWRPKLKATLATDFSKGSGAVRFVWARCWQKEEGLIAEPLGYQGNGMLKSAMSANALIVLAECSPLAAGSEVTVMLLGSL